MAADTVAGIAGTLCAQRTTRCRGGYRFDQDPPLTPAVKRPIGHVAADTSDILALLWTIGQLKQKSQPRISTTMANAPSV
jgi:hypothetical protein